MPRRPLLFPISSQLIDQLISVADEAAGGSTLSATVGIIAFSAVRQARMALHNRYLEARARPRLAGSSAPLLFANSGSALRIVHTRVMKIAALLVLIATGFMPAVLAQAPEDPPAHAGAISPEGASGSDLIDKILLITVGPSNLKELTEKQRFHEYLLATAGPVPLIGEATAAGLGQWLNSPTQWGQGWAPYGRRFGTNLAYNAVRQTITYGTSIVFHEDNRYFPSSAHGFWARTRHALVSTFTARHPNGREMVSISSVSGVLGASAISTIWTPGSGKRPGRIAANAGISFAATAGFNVVREFLPDILHRPRNSAVVPPPSVAGPAHR